jgi:bacterioferritin-associated ferredoxin
VLACELPSPGRVHRLPYDPLRPVGRLAQRWPPWFYERRFLRSEPLGRAALNAIRRASAAPSLGPPPVRGAPGCYAEEEAELVVVGDAGTAPAGARVVSREQGELAIGVYPERMLGVVTADGLRTIRFERLVIATGGYERLPPIPGNDLPGVIGFKALERYARGVRAGTRVAVWAPEDLRPALAGLAGSARLEVVWLGEEAPRAILGRRRVTGVRTDRTIACDLFVTAVAQPALELALQAGATATLTDGELPILVATHTPPWLELAGAASRRTSGVPWVAADDDAFACLCEDVRVKDVRSCVEQGFRHPELVKRRTGAMTGPCQGKLCAAAVLSLLRESGVEATPTSARPLARPVALVELACDA